MRAGKTGCSLSGAASPRSASRLILGLAARMLPLALLRAAAPPARPNRARLCRHCFGRRQSCWVYVNSQAATSRSHHNIHGVTKPVKTAARVPEPCGDEPWCQPSSLAADPSIRVWLLIRLKNGHSAPTLGVLSVAAACTSHATGPVELATRCEREKYVLASVALASPRSASRSRTRHAARHSSSALLRATSRVLRR